MLIVTARSELARVKLHEKRVELARLSLAHFVRYRFEGDSRQLLWNWHLDCISEHLEAVTSRQITRLLINMPPRFLKTEVTAECWPAWMIGRHNGPLSSMVSASYSTSLAARASLRTLAMINKPWYRYLFGTIALSKATAVEWETEGGCSRTAAGSAGTITGKGGDHLLGDDILKPKEANSEVVRENVNEWIGETFHSRLNDPMQGTKVFIGQRVHERDPFGYLWDLMKNPEAEQWTKLELPLENVEGKAKVYSFDKGSGNFTYIRKPQELLHPARMGPTQVKQAKAVMRLNFEGQYNQRPQKMAGGRLQPALLVRVKRTAQQLIRDLGLTPHIWIDIAVKSKELDKDDPDWSVAEVWARDQLQRRILLHVWRGQVTTDVLAGAIIDLRKTYCPNGIVRGEKIGLQHAFRPTMQLVCQVRHIPQVPILDCGLSAQVDPHAKVAPFESALHSGVVVVPADATWLPDFEAEMRSWPKGAHDDQMVTAGYANHDLDEFAAGEAPPAHDNIPPDQITGQMLAEVRRKAQRLKNGDREKPAGPGWTLS